MTQGNPFSNNPNAGQSNGEQGNPFGGSTTGQGTTTSAGAGSPSNPAPTRTVVERGPIVSETNQGNPFSPNPANVTQDAGDQGQFFGDTGAGTSTPASGSASGSASASAVDIYLREADLSGTTLNLRRANASDLSVTLAPLIDGINTDSYIEAFTIDQNGLATITRGGTDPATFTAQIQFPDTPQDQIGARSAVLTGTRLDFYSGTTPGGSPLFSVDLSSLAGMGGTDTHLSTITGEGTDTLVFAFNNADQSNISVDMNAYLNSQVRLALNDLTNVAAFPAGGDVLSWNATRQEWTARSETQATHVFSGRLVGSNSTTLRLTLTDLTTDIDIPLDALVAHIQTLFPTDTNRFINGWTYDDTNHTISMTYNDGTTPLPALDLSSLVDSVSTLASLTDVTVTNPANRNVLFYNGTRWVNQILSINDLLEVENTTTHEAGEILIRNSANTGYEARQINISDAADVNTSGATSGQVLRFNGSQWLPFTLPAGTGGSITVANEDSTETAMSSTVQFEIAPGVPYRWTIRQNTDGAAEVVLAPPASPFDFSVSGVPGATSVFTAQSNFRIQPGNITGTTVSLDSFGPSGGATPNLPNFYVDYDGSQFNAAGTYNFSLTATGNDTDGANPRQITRTAQLERFIPGGFVVANNAPTSLAGLTEFNSSNRQTLRINGVTGQTVFVAVPTRTSSNPSFELMNFPQDALMAGTFSVTDSDNQAQQFQVWSVGTKTAGTLNLVYIP